MNPVWQNRPTGGFLPCNRGIIKWRSQKQSSLTSFRCSNWITHCWKQCTFFCFYKKHDLKKHMGLRLLKFTPLSANVQYTWHDTLRTAVTFWHFSCKSLKFPTKWYTELCNSVKSWEIPLQQSKIFDTFGKESTKKRLRHLKG